MEYTKGTWYIEEESGNILSIPDGKDSPIIIADLSRVDPKSIRELKANARLIAAAPEMYEALKYLTNTVAQYSQYTVDNSESYRMALKALSKAEKRA